MSSTTASDVISNLSNLLPTGTFLAFQALAPLFTNNGVCQQTERVMTGILLCFFTVLCFMLNFVDSVTTEGGIVYYGIVTRHGLYNPLFQKSNIPGDLLRGDSYFTGGDDNNDYKLHSSDFLNGLLDILAFATLSCLTPPVTTCYYPDIPSTVVKTAPILAGMVAGVVFAFAPPGRNGIGFALTTAGFGLVPEKAKKCPGSASTTKHSPDSGSTSNHSADLEATDL